MLDYNKLDVELRAAIEQLPPLQITRDNVAQIRAMMASRPVPPSPLEVLRDEVVVAGNACDVPVYRFRKSERPNQPALLWIHGGGYVMGSAMDERARVIANALDCNVFSVDYRLAPEHPFPAGPDDCYATLEWMMHNGDSLGIDTARIAIGGASAGGGMAAGVALMNRDRANHPLVLQLLLYPMIDNLHDTQSGQYENHPVWNQGTSFRAWEMYLNGTPGKSAPSYAAAARADDLRGLPPAYVCVGSEDLFRDEDVAYAQRLGAADVPCELAVFPGLYHGGDVFVPNAAVSQRLQRSFLAALGDALR
ncbi:MAG: alpha/beta hydrolase [Gammaproteobacteria bacterium]|nr:alpha/beta hydrolase [Gammaproteobacteria bacterium]